MDAEEFVHRVETVIRDGSIDATISTLRRPPGRRPREDVVRLSHWYNSLDDEAKRSVHEVVKSAVNQSLFKFFCVLDGSAAIEAGPDRGELQLFYKKGKSTLLNPQDGAQQALHELFSK